MTPFDYIINQMIPNLNKHKVELQLDFNSNEVYVGDLGCSGYFDSECRVLATAIGDKPTADWLSTLLHEESHFDQWREGTEVWTRIEENKEADGDVDDWLGGMEIDNIEVQAKNLCLVELDCEIRTIPKLSLFSELPDPEEYIQKANSYVAFYKVMYERRQWYASGKPPYGASEIWKDMPKEFLAPEDYWDNYKFNHINWDLVF